MGRMTYEVGLREGITNPYRPLRQIVFSSTMTESPDSAVELCRDSPLDMVKQLKAEHGMDIWICGGAKLATALFSEIDEFILKINPVFIGAGIPLFDGVVGTLPAVPIEHKAYPNGFVLARYERGPISEAPTMAK
jgi:dihydrofolate reductase